MHKNMFRTVAASAVLIGITGLAGCSAGSNSSGSHSGMPMPMGSQSATAPSSATTSTSPAVVHNGQDVMFAQMMIPHHQQAIEMSDLLLTKHGVDSRVTGLARQIKAAQTPEITTMRGWLTSWGAEPSPSAMGGGMDHGGMGDGMMSRAEMGKLKEADGNQAARLFLTGMIAHHRGAIAMASTEKSQGKNSEAKKLAGSIISSQQAEIDTMTKLVAHL